MKSPQTGMRLAAGATLCAVLFLSSPMPAHAAEGRVLSKHVPAAVAAGLPSVGDLPDTNILHLSIGLPFRDQAGLDKFLQDVYDPASPSYHHYLSVKDFTESYGPAKADYEAVRAFAKANGMTESMVHPNRLVISVDATVAEIRKAFHVNIHTYAHPTEKRTFFAPDAEPTVDAGLTVLHIAGLDNFVIPRPLGKMSKPIKVGNPMGGTNTPVPFGGSGLGGTYVSQDFRNAYLPGVTLTGAGQSVALFEFDTYYSSDIVTYEEQTGLPDIKRGEGAHRRWRRFGRRRDGRSLAGHRNGHGDGAWPFRDLRI